MFGVEQLTAILDNVFNDTTTVNPIVQTGMEVGHRIEAMRGAAVRANGQNVQVNHS
jgi:hypothetical protein